MMLSPYDDPRTASEFSSADLLDDPATRAELAIHNAEIAVVELQSILEEYPISLVHYNGEIGDLASDLFSIASKARNPQPRTP